MPDATPDLNDSETADPALRSRTIYYTDPFLSAGKYGCLAASTLYERCGPAKFLELRSAR